MERVRGENDPTQKMNLLREYTQAFILRSLHENEAFRNLSFVGGTALRFLYDLPRFSEDLDFSLERKEGYEPEKWLAKLKRELQYAGFEPEIKWNDRKTVQVAWIGFSGLLKEAGLAADPRQKLSIKLEIDTRPPENAMTEVKVVNRFFLLALRHHNLPFLMAGKIRALLTRGFTKGRDWYDILWYRSRSPSVEPDIEFLRACLEQGEVGRGGLAERWREELRHQAEKADWDAIRRDVEPFLERPEESRLLRADYIIQVL